jgi:pre-mRNA-processing factor SLU7
MATQASTAQSLLASGSGEDSRSREIDTPASDGKIEQNYSKKRVGEGDVQLDQAKLAEAIQEEKKRKLRGDNTEDRFGKKRKETGSHDVTEEELGTFIFPLFPVGIVPDLFFSEAYRMNRRMTEDPMANYVDTDI